MSYFQDLPEEYRDRIFEAIREGHYDIGLIEAKMTLEEKDEIADGWLNRNNDPETIKELVNEICLD